MSVYSGTFQFFCTLGKSFPRTLSHTFFSITLTTSRFFKCLCIDLVILNPPLFIPYLSSLPLILLLLNHKVSGGKGKQELGQYKSISLVINYLSCTCLLKLLLDPLTCEPRQQCINSLRYLSLSRKRLLLATRECPV